MIQRRAGRQSAESARQTRKTIICAAAQLFCEHGYDAVSIRAISERADVSHSLLRHHFGTKEKIWLTVSDAMYLYFQDVLLNLEASIDPELPPRQRLYLLMVKFQAFLIREPQLLQMANANMNQSEQHLAEVLAKKEQELGVIQEMVEACRAQGEPLVFEATELLWCTIAFGHAGLTLQELLQCKVFPDHDNPELSHWHLFARTMARQLGVADDLVTMPKSLDEVLQGLEPVDINNCLDELV